MNIKRRGFLKGLMALTGAAVVGLPQLEAADVVAEAEQIIEAHTPRPSGPLGSVRIGDRWYAAHEYSIDVHTDFVLENYGGAWTRHIPRARSWSIDLTLSDIAGLNPFDASGQEIEIVCNGRTFTGEAFIACTGGCIGIDYDVMFNVTLQGIGELSYSA